MDTWDSKKNEVKNKAEELYKKGKEEAVDMYSEAKDKAESAKEHVKETISDLYQGSKEKLTSLETCLEDYSDELIHKVRKKPITSLLIAGGVGFILSKLLHHCHSEK